MRRRNRRSRICRAAAGGRLLRGRPQRDRGRRRSAQDRGASGGRELRRGRVRRDARGHLEPPVSDPPLRRAVPLRGRDRRGADAAHAEPRARPRRRSSAAASAIAAVLQRGQLIVAGVDHLPGHHARAARAAARGVRPGRGRRLQRRVLAGARRPGPHRLHAAQHAEGRRRPDRRPAASAPPRSTARSATTSSRVSTPEVAELTKLLENIFRSVNIALVNELAMLCDRMGIDIWEVVDAASTKPYGFMRFEPGPGMGGHCLPVDPFYLSWRAREFDVADRVHRARRRGQPADAVLLRREDRARAERRMRSRCAARASRCSASPTRPASATCASRRR